MKKQTAIEWLVEELEKHHIKTDIKNTVAFNQAKAMEKEQIVDAFVECWKENMPEGYECKQSAEQYYNHNFES